MKGRVKKSEEAPLFVRETRWSEALRVFKYSHFNFVRGESKGSQRQSSSSVVPLLVSLSGIPRLLLLLDLFLRRFDSGE